MFASWLNMSLGFRIEKCRNDFNSAVCEIEKVNFILNSRCPFLHILSTILVFRYKLFFGDIFQEKFFKR